MKSHAILTKAEIQTHAQTLRPLVTLFAISLMHGSNILLSDGSKIRLEGFIHDSGGVPEVHVGAAVPVTFATGKTVEVMSAMFTSEHDIHEYLDLELQAVDRWNFDVEIGGNRKLRIFK